MIQLGNEVKDSVSGFQGIAICRHSYLQGCDRITVQPPTNDKGEMPEALAFDEPQLVVVGVGVAPNFPQEVKKDNGGPNKFPDTEKPRGGRRDERSSRR